MAKSSSAPGLDRVRDLFKSAEQAVLESSTGKNLLAASRKQLDRTLAQARSLRDKWRDLYAGQTRATKRSSGPRSGANARSRTKSDMFTAAIGRLQARLADIGLAPATAGTGKRPGKAARRAGHRSTRAGVKAGLAAAVAAGATAPAPRRTGRKKLRAAPAVAAPVPAPTEALPKRRPAKAAGKRRPAKKVIAKLAQGGQAVRFDASKQRSAKASATAARLKLDGKTTRRGGHVLAAGKRRQAARDRRGR